MIATDTNAPAAADWDLTPYFSGLGEPDYVEFTRALESELREWSEAEFEATPEALLAIEGLDARLSHLGSYLGCRAAADSRDDAVASENAALAKLRALQEKVAVGLKAALGALSDEAFEALVGDERLAPVRYFVTRLRERARRTMEPELERLAADLGVTGLSAWGRLYGTVTGKLEFDLELPGQPVQRKPIALVRSLSADPDAEVRAAVDRGAARAFEGASDTLAACLNGMVGTRLELYRRRGIDDFLEPALHDAGIERGTLETMLGVVRERQPMMREYLRHKARLLGMERLGLVDVAASLPAPEGAPSGDSPTWADARDAVLDAFGQTYPDMRSFARHAFDSNWIDYTSRPGKRPGAFCSSSSVAKESRVFMSFNGTSRDTRTLAHELGHAFHNWVMRDMRPWARRYPMTLAETASTFGERLVTDAELRAAEGDDARRRVLLDERLGDAATMLLNIPMRFDFEKALYERRANGEPSVAELKEMMLVAQRANYGDGLDPERLDPWFWASKLHFFIAGLTFYNFPYTFGFLFSMGIFARAQAEGAAFLPIYEELLRRTGSDSAEVVAREVLGVELGQPEFWNASIDLVEDDWKAYRAL